MSHTVGYDFLNSRSIGLPEKKDHQYKVEKCNMLPMMGPPIGPRAYNDMGLPLSCGRNISAQVATPREGGGEAKDPQKNRRMISAVML